MSVNRRSVLKHGAASVLAAASQAFIAPVWANSNLELGQLQIDVVSDGHLTLPASFLFAGMPDSELETILNKYGVLKDEIEPDCNLTLVRDEERTILFDVGSGPNFMPGAGKIVEALEAVNVSPSQVTDIVFTHAHPDHLWGLLDDFDELLFPEARYFVGKAEWEYWTDPHTVEEIGDSRQAFAAGAMRNLMVIKDKANLFNPGEEIIPGIYARATPGHTPGHSSFEIRSGNESVMIVGDAIGNQHVAFEKPLWEVNSDQDKAMGAEARGKLLDQLATEKTRLIGFHLPYPGIGYAERKDGAFRFVAA